MNFLRGKDNLQIDSNVIDTILEMKGMKKCPHCGAKYKMNEQLEEGSYKCPKCGKSYATEGASGHDYTGDGKVDKKDLKAHKKFHKLMDKELKNEEVEPIDELSKKALANYIGSASVDKSDAAHEIGRINQIATSDGTTKAERKRRDKLSDRHSRRSGGIQTAANKLANEEEQLDEAYRMGLTPDEHHVHNTFDGVADHLNRLTHIVRPGGLLHRKIKETGGDCKPLEDLHKHLSAAEEKHTGAHQAATSRYDNYDNKGK